MVDPVEKCSHCGGVGCLACVAAPTRDPAIRIADDPGYAPMRLLEGDRIELHARIDRLEAANLELRRKLAETEQRAEDWKRRAIAHGCDAERGDADCG